MLTLKALFFIAVMAKVNAMTKLDEVFAWKELPLAWPSEDIKKDAVKNGGYIPEHHLPAGLDRWKDKLFVTIPRWTNNVSISLGYLSLNGPVNKTAAVIPYPDWKANTLPKGDAKPEDDNHIISVFRIAVDVCDRLWVVDTGMADLLLYFTQISPPAIVIYDLKTDKLIKRYTFPANDINYEPTVANIVVDTNKNKCEDAFAYIPAFGSNEIIVYSLKENDSWKFQYKSFPYDQLHAHFNVGGINFQWTDSHFSLALGPEESNGFHTMFFHPLASLNEFSVSTLVLKNKTLTRGSHIDHLFKIEGIKGVNSQTSASVFDEKSNTLFLTQLNKDAVACWNPKKTLDPKNIDLIAQDHTGLVFINDIKIDEERNLWILSDKMPQFIYENLNNQEVNYRIFKVNVDDAIAGTACAV